MYTDSVDLFYLKKKYIRLLKKYSEAQELCLQYTLAFDESELYLENHRKVNLELVSTIKNRDTVIENLREQIKNKLNIQKKLH